MPKQRNKRSFPTLEEKLIIERVHSPQTVWTVLHEQKGMEGGFAYTWLTPHTVMLEPSSCQSCNSTVTVFILEGPLEHSLQELLLSALPAVTESCLQKGHARGIQVQGHLGYGADL